MPLYEYRCGQCGERFERLLSFSAASAPVACPNCGATETRKQISSFATSNATTSSSSASSCAPSGGG